MPTLTPLLPALTTTALLTYAFDEHLFLSPFLSPSTHPTSQTFLPIYFRTWLARAKYVIWVGYPLTTLTAAWNLYNLSTSPTSLTASTTSLKWNLYAAGMTLNLAHIFLFGPKALGLLEDIKAGRGQEGEDKGGKVTESLAAWMRMHVVRSWCTDFVAWGCFVGAVVVG